MSKVSGVVLGVEDPPKSMTDERLVQCCLEGDRHSFRLLYRRHQQRVRQILYHICDLLTLDDLVQEVFLRAWKGLPKFRQSAQFCTLLYRIAWNVGSDRRKILAQDKSRLQIVAREIAIQHDDPNVLVGIASPLENLHYQDLVRRGLSALSKQHRAVLILHDLDEIPQKEVTEILEAYWHRLGSNPVVDIDRDPMVELEAYLLQSDDDVEDI